MPGWNPNPSTINPKAGRKYIRTAYKIAALLAAVFTFAPSAILAGPDANGVLFVNKANTGGTQSGDSWTNAIPELGTALDMAKSFTPGTVSQIWVAQGTYAPTTIPDDFQPFGTPLTERDKTFVLLKDVSIYGGFNGTETTIWERTLPNTATVLTGDLADSSQNAYHVVVSSGNVGSARLDRLTISDGRADFDKPYDPDDPSTHNVIMINGENVNRTYGGGISIRKGSPIINNVLFTNNYALYDGGACSIDISFAKIQNVIFTQNTCDRYGAAVDAWDSTLDITNMLVTGNLGQSMASALQFNRSTVRLTNATVSSNRGTNSNTAAIYSVHEGCNIHLRNCIVAGNVKDDGSESNTATFNTGTVEFHSSIIGDTYYDATGTAQTPSSLTLADLFVDPEPAASAPTQDGDYHLKADSYAIDAGDGTYFDPGQTPDLSHITADLDQNIRIIPPGIDLGPYEFGSTSSIPAWSLY